MKTINRNSIIITIIITIIGLIIFIFGERFINFYLMKYGLVNGGKWVYLKPINRTTKKQINLANTHPNYCYDGLYFELPIERIVSENQSAIKDYRSINLKLRKINGEDAIIRIWSETHDEYDIYAVCNSALEFDPREVSLFESADKLKWHLSLLNYKKILISKDTNTLYKYSTNEIKIFQINENVIINKSIRFSNKLIVFLNNQNRAFNLVILNFNQDELDYIISSLNKCTASTRQETEGR